MGNQLGLRLLAAPGHEIVCDWMAHIARAELGAAAAFSGITFRTWSSERGELDVERVRALIAPDSGPYFVSTTAIALENTHNLGGGTILDPAQVAAVIELASAHGLRMHLDGARIWHTHVATATPLRELAAGFDTVSVCLSKGLGAPIGSVLVSSSDRIAEARIWRKRYGGGMRQAGVIAAAGRYALAHHVDRLADDHARARRIVTELGGDPARCDTNIILQPVADASAVAAAAREHGVLVNAVGPKLLRLITHLDVDDDGVDYAVKVLRGLINV
jgi:threonine aldolase